MNNDEIDDALKHASGASPAVDPMLLERISSSLGSGLGAVRPLPPTWALVTALIAGSAIVAGAGGIIFGPHGIRAMSALDIGMIFPALGIATGLAAAVFAGEMIPGSRRAIPAWLLLMAACLGLTVVFATLFHDYRTEGFVSQGLVCLRAGLVVAIPAACISGWLLRRGFAVDSLAAGIAQGTLAGLVGLGMLEVHCPNFEAPHVMIWHTSVVAVSGAVGALLVWLRRLR